ncbi:LysR family transcriptional regulator [Aquicoccus porphyridii]|uniref:LysR family transcriptional regulator n=1 Tax=Aquicoccus porphyridii TaxID=1852029 RepID=A0A5A9ZKN3_9RHOB|nr:LysR family transcriptional regulator [Aquicoccus porphyridii]KAA0917738.1 LysR family transcriptional regulator [Aquicoccus porphyridii]RAI55810.1 LysR family transcriptional regulator [Rhodobacteraceae bacterium AsT-22]
MTLISLEQWRALVGVVDAGTYALAADLLGKSQSSVSYAVNQIEERTGVELFRIQGRKAVLTVEGKALYLRAKYLLAEAGRIEKAAAEMAVGHEAELRLAADIMFPPAILLESIKRFAAERPTTRLEIYETVVAGSMELLADGQVDVAIAPELPNGFLGEPIMRVQFLPVAAPSHPLHRLEKVTLNDLRDHHHLIIRDSGARKVDQGAWQVSQNRIIFSQTSTSIEAARRGVGFSWYAETLIGADLEAGTLKELPLAEPARRSAELFLVFRDAVGASPGVRRLVEILRCMVSDPHGRGA